MTAHAAAGVSGSTLIRLDARVNGEAVALEIQASETLAEVLRERLGLTGTKVSCDVQVCGACTVLLEGLPVSACTTLAYEASGRAVTTIEGLAGADGRLHPLQQAFLDEFAFQCGFCTPGMILAAKALLDERPDVSEQEIVEHMDGNLCRCTGYTPIVRAIRRVQAASRSER